MKIFLLVYFLIIIYVTHRKLKGHHSGVPKPTKKAARKQSCRARKSAKGVQPDPEVLNVTNKADEQSLMVWIER
jgi:hypothetical protein